MQKSPRTKGRKPAESKKSKEAAPTSTKGRNSGQANKSKESAPKTNERDESVTTEQSSSEEEGSTDNVDDEDDEDSESEYSRENDSESSETSKASVAIDEVPVPGEVAVVQQKLLPFQPIQCSNAFVQKSD